MRGFLKRLHNTVNAKTEATPSETKTAGKLMSVMVFSIPTKQKYHYIKYV